MEGQNKQCHEGAKVHLEGPNHNPGRLQTWGIIAILVYALVRDPLRTRPGKFFGYPGYFSP